MEMFNIIPIKNVYAVVNGNLNALKKVSILLVHYSKK